MFLHRLAARKIPAFRRSPGAQRGHEGGKIEGRERKGRRTHSDGRGMVGVTAGKHGQYPAPGISPCAIIVPPARHRRIEDLNSVDRQHIEHLLANPPAPAIVGMRGNGQSTARMDGIHNLRSRSPGHPRQRDAKTQEMAVRRGHLHARHHQKSLHRRAVLARQSLHPKVRMRGARIMIRNGNPAQTTALCRRYQFLRRIRRIGGKK